MTGTGERTRPRDAAQCGCGGACKHCRVRALGRLRRRYTFTPELLDELRVAYCGTRWQISKALNRLQRKTGWPRYAFLNEAKRRGWNTGAGRRVCAGGEVERFNRGYSIAELQRLFGEPEHKIQSWLRRRLLVAESEDEPIPGREVRRFLHGSFWEWDLRRVDQAWVKWMLFGGGER